MSILFVMIPLALVLLAAAVAVFFWAVGSGQFDDLESKGALVLFDAPVARSAADDARFVLTDAPRVARGGSSGGAAERRG